MSADERGVQFESPHTGQLTYLTPEHCIEIQVSLPIRDDIITTKQGAVP